MNNPIEEDFSALLIRVRDGDPDAIEAIFRRYEGAIRREVRLRLRDSSVRRTVGESDIQQMVMVSFFARAALGQFDLESPSDLLNLFVTMTRNKIVDVTRRKYRLKEGGGHVVEPLETAAGEARPIPHDGPTPSSIVAQRELVAKLRSQMSADELRVCDLRHGGASWAEIAAIFGQKPDALRKLYVRAIDRVAREANIDDTDSL